MKCKSVNINISIYNNHISKKINQLIKNYKLHQVYIMNVIFIALGFLMNLLDTEIDGFFSVLFSFLLVWDFFYQSPIILKNQFHHLLLDKAISQLHTVNTKLKYNQEKPETILILKSLISLGVLSGDIHRTYWVNMISTLYSCLHL